MIEPTAYSALVTELYRSGAPPQVATLKAYIAAASGTAGDTLADRHDEVFRLIRETVSYNEIYKDQALRDFLVGTMAWNPYIPAQFHQEVQRTAAYTPPRNTFVETWKERQPPERVRQVEIDVADFLAFFSINPPMFENFARMNVHGPGYFFAKSLEWYLSYAAVRAHTYVRVLDIGAASTWFASLLDRSLAALDIMLVDLGFAPGLRRLSPRIAQLGEDAGNLSLLRDGSVDFVCMHNAFEHFSGDSDRRCIREVARVLRPGGRALITPLFTAARFTMAFNPLSAFFFRDFGDPASMVAMFRQAAAERRADIVSTLAMASPYMHSYDYPTVEKRLLAYAGGLEPCLLLVSFSPASIARQPRLSVHGLEFDPTAYGKTPMVALELRQPD